jgi:hypothetical protein
MHIDQNPRGTTRRRMLGRAGAVAAAGGVASLTGGGLAPAAVRGESLGRFLDFTVTQEQFGVTFLTTVIANAAGTPAEPFVPVLKAANTTEFDHVQALKKIGADR